MHFSLDKKKFEEAVSRAERITGKNLSLAILRSVLLTAHKDSVEIRATNLDLGIEVVVPASVKEKGTVAVPGDTLRGFLGAIEIGDEVSCKNNGSQLEVTSGKSVARLATQPHEDFPTLPGVSREQTLTIPARDIVSGFKSVWYSASVSSMKPELSSVLVEGDTGALVFAATDSFRLAEKRIHNKNIDEFKPLLVPVKNVPEVIRNLESVDGDVEILVGENQVSFVADGITITSRAIDGVFPDYKQIIPKSFETEATVLKEDLANALKVATIFADRFNQTTFSLAPKKKQFSITTKNQDLGESTVDVDAALEGEALDISFNHKYLTGGLTTFTTDSITLRFSGGSSKPLLMQGVGDASFVYLVMPMNR